MPLEIYRQAAGRAEADLGCPGAASRPHLPVPAHAVTSEKQIPFSLISEGAVRAYLARIEAIDCNGPALRSVILTMPVALAVARQLDSERAAGYWDGDGWLDYLSGRDQRNRRL